MWFGSKPLAANIIITIIININILLLLLLIVVMLEAQRWSVGAAGAAMVSQAVGIPAAGPSCYPCLAMLYENTNKIQIQIQGNMYKDNISIVIYLATMLRLRIIYLVHDVALDL